MNDDKRTKMHMLAVRSFQKHIKGVTFSKQFCKNVILSIKLDYDVTISCNSYILSFKDGIRLNQILALNEKQP